MSRFVAIHRKFVTNDQLIWWEKALYFLLIPLSIVYGGIGWIRQLLYKTGVLPSYRSSLPIVSVGNITAGGTGKTPTVDWLVRQFQQIGKRPAIVSRGYSGKFSGPVGVVLNGQELQMSADMCGDEPLLLAKKNTTCPVVVSRKRADGLRFLEQRGDIDVVILDDAFQHLAVKRDIDLVLLDAQFPLGNGWPLPAGNLREFSGALKRADFLLMTRSEYLDGTYFKEYPVYQSTHQLSDVVVDLKGAKTSVETLKSLKLFAFSGIANPDGFFLSLEDLGFALSGTLSLDDHVEYDFNLIDKIKKITGDVDALITTEKDGVKLAADMFELPCYQVPVDIKITRSTELFENIVEKLWSS